MGFNELGRRLMENTFETAAVLGRFQEQGCRMSPEHEQGLSLGGALTEAFCLTVGTNYALKLIGARVPELNNPCEVVAYTAMGFLFFRCVDHFASRAYVHMLRGFDPNFGG